MDIDTVEWPLSGVTIHRSIVPLQRSRWTSASHGSESQQRVACCLSVRRRPQSIADRSRHAKCVKRTRFDHWIPVHFNGSFQGPTVARAFATADKSLDGRGLPAEAVRRIL
jgi:hypothetical protein